MYGSTQSESTRKRVTVPEIRDRKTKGPAIAAVAVYDYTMARLFDEAGVDIVVVGDSLGMVVQGLDNTMAVCVEDICYHGRAVARAISHAHVVGDMPFMSYESSATQAIDTAGTLLKRAGVQSVKLEGGQEIAEHVRRMVEVGIPVMGHVGLTPQRVHALGGFRIQGKSAEQAQRILQDAQALEQAGAYALVLEAMPSDLAAMITRTVSIPTIGIGAGKACDGQVLVSTDLLGMTRGHTPRFVKRFAEIGDEVVAAARSYIEQTRSGLFPAAMHEYAVHRSGPNLDGLVD